MKTGRPQKQLEVPKKYADVLFVEDLGMRLNVSGYRRRFGAFLCYCGDRFECDVQRIFRGQQKSCGCRDGGVANTTHGLSRTRLYNVWKGMRQRCTNPNSDSYPRYGARGITCCEEWDDFEVFLRDMGEPPTDVHTLEREDNNLGYSKQNCVWATPTEQGRNKSNNRLITFQGVTLCISEFASMLFLPRRVITQRLDRGWSVEKALTTPVRAMKPRVTANLKDKLPCDTQPHSNS